MKLLRKWVKQWLAEDGAVQVDPPSLQDDPIKTISQASKRGQVNPVHHEDGRTGYADVAALFVDELILRYFYSIVVRVPGGQLPWHDLCLSNPWLLNMPELWQLLTGYELSKAQLDWAANKIIERLARSANAQNQQALTEAEKSTNT